MRRLDAAGTALLGAAGALVAGALFLGHGSSETPVFWLGSLALLAVTAALVAALVGKLAWPGGGLGLAVALAGLTAWSGLSILWSEQGDASWNGLNRLLAYLSVAGLGLFLGTRVPRGTVAAWLGGLLGLLLLVALASKVFPSLYADGGRIARLRYPVGYWNALALLGDVALALALWLVVSRRRVEGVLLLYVALVATLLTYSRAGLAIGAVVAAGWIWLGPARLESLAALLCAGVPASVAGGIALALPGLAKDGEAMHTRAHDGHAWGLVVVALGIVAVGLARVVLPRAERSPREALFLRRTLASLGALAALLLVASIVRAGGPGPWAHDRVHEFASPVSVQVTQGPGRLTSTSSNHRWLWWQRASAEWEGHPAGGTGAQTFALTRQLFQRSFVPYASEPHSLPLQLLTELGLVGLALGVGVFGTALRGARREPAELALWLGLVAYVLHALIDYDLNLVAVSFPFFLVAGCLVAGAPRPARSRGWLWAAGAAGAAAVAFSSLLSPFLAQRKLDAGAAAASRGDAHGALKAYRSADSLNPLGVDALFARAQLEPSPRAAKELLVRAVHRQPLNSRTYFELGDYELRVMNDICPAYEALNRAYTLDQFRSVTRGGSLDLARRRARGASCPPLGRGELP